MVSTETGTGLDDALRFCQSGAFEQAEQICRQVLVQDADAPDAWNMLAVVLYQQGELEEAAKAAENATQLRPAIPPYWLTRGNIAMARNRNREAQSSFGRALELHPEFAEAHYRLALSHHREDRIAEAIAGYRQALRHAPDVAEIHYQLAEALTSEARWNEALSSFRQAFKRDAEGAFDRRGALDCLWFLQFDTLPEFWQEELVRFFARADVDKTRYVAVGLRALKAKRAFRVMLDATRKPNARLERGSVALRDVMCDRLFLLLLQDALVVDAGLETLLTHMRAALLNDDRLRAQAPLDFLGALALQCFNNEFIFALTDTESVQVAKVGCEIESALKPDVAVSDPVWRAVAVFAMHSPLSSLPGVDVLMAQTQTPPALERLLQRAVTNVLTERELRPQIQAIGEISDAVSLAVRDMYEEHPYPRWFSFDRGAPVTLAEWMERLVTRPKFHADFPTTVQILVAGCGTGKEAIDLAATIAGARVLAIDLSLTSLAYAQRMANELGLTNVEFRQADILEMGVFDQRFDMISASGVLHHLRDPQAGLRVLVGLLRPGGLLRLALYSQRARSTLTAARETIRQRQLSPTPGAIREFRQEVFRQEDDGAFKSLRSMLDFYSMSMCRDLLFHVQEHQFTLPKIAAMLLEHGLNVLSLLQEIPRPAMQDYRRMFPRDAALTDLENWDAFERQYPQTFAGMYHILCQRPAAATADDASTQTIPANAG